MKDDELWEAMKILAADERPVVAVVVEHLAEVDRRSLFNDRGYRSLYDYCVYSLKYAEGAAYRRIRAARAVGTRPGLLTDLRSGALSLETLTLLHPHLEAPYFDDLLRRARARTTREVEMIAAEYGIAIRARDVVRFIGMEAGGGRSGISPESLALVAASSEMKSEVMPMSSSATPNPDAKKLVRFAFTADEELYKMVLRSQQLMRHKYPDGRLEGIFRDALKLLIEEKDLGLRAAKAAARKSGRHAAKVRSRATA
jgi:hypothetical protein